MVGYIWYKLLQIYIVIKSIKQIMFTGTECNVG